MMSKIIVSFILHKSLFLFPHVMFIHAEACMFIHVHVGS